MKKRVIYRSTMNPGEVSEKPGKDSMGMEMVPEEIVEAWLAHTEALRPLVTTDQGGECKD